MLFSFDWLTVWIWCFAIDNSVSLITFAADMLICAIRIDAAVDVELVAYQRQCAFLFKSRIVELFSDSLTLISRLKDDSRCFFLSVLDWSVHLQRYITRSNHWLLLSYESRESESERFVEIRRYNADEASANSRRIKLSLLAENVSIDHWSSRWDIDYILLGSV